MVADALLILVLGMGGVFLFLLALVLVMNLIAQLLPIVETPVVGAKKDSHRSEQEQIIAVLQAAVHRYESDINNAGQ